MTIEEFKKLKVGDKVRIKTLQELKEEFGESECSICGIHAINSKDLFVPGMFDTAGTVSIITSKDKDAIHIVDNIDYRYSYDVIAEKVFEYPTIVMHLIRGDKTIVKLSNGKVGIAKCSPEDQFDVYEGLRIATARAYGKEPFETEKVKEVKRVPCKGEYVKLINPDSTSVVYGFKENQIVQIKGVDGEVPWVTTATNRDVYLFPDEYVVLENYDPKK